MRVGLTETARYPSYRGTEEVVYLRIDVHHPPATDNDIPDHWAMFVFDPDGMRVEIAHWPARDPAGAQA